MIAVFLHYLFLVTFMWMLMEGVVLYIVLVKVFVNGSEKAYIILFTVLSYGEYVHHSYTWSGIVSLSLFFVGNLTMLHYIGWICSLTAALAVSLLH